MRMIMRVTMPNEPFNSYVRDGSAGAKMAKVLGEVKPEAAYFFAPEGHRGGILIVNMDNSSEIPGLAEPFFLMFDAKVHFDPCMTPEDLAKSGLDSIGQKWS